MDKLKIETLSIISHELGTPLVTIKSYLNLILKNKASKIDKKERRQLEICSRNVTRMEDLVNYILDISKLEIKEMKFDMRNVDIWEIIVNVKEDLQILAKKKKITLQVKIPSKPIVVNSDEKRLTQVLSNLVKNAIKFTHKDGTVVVSAKKRSNDVLVSVKDNGIGIAKKDIPKLFKKFSQLDTSSVQNERGTGLGLVISKQIVEAHKGKIWVKSAGLGKGSTFNFTLPISSKKKNSKVL